MSKVNDLIEYMSIRKSSIACSGKNGLRRAMVDLGFEDTPGNCDGHRIFTHPYLSEVADFISTSIDCGHSQTGNIKMPYIVKMLGVLKKYKIHLEELEGI